MATPHDVAMDGAGPADPLWHDPRNLDRFWWIAALASAGEKQGCWLRGSRGSHRTPSHPVEAPFDPLHIGKVAQEMLLH